MYSIEDFDIVHQYGLKCMKKLHKESALQGIIVRQLSSYRQAEILTDTISNTDRITIRQETL